MGDRCTYSYIYAFISLRATLMLVPIINQNNSFSARYSIIRSSYYFINFNSPNSSLAIQVVKWLHKPLKLEHAMPTTPHANGEPLLKRSSFLSQFATILLVVWSANGDYCSYYFQFTKGRYLLMRCAGNCVIHPAK